jgi:hypothetical protein
MLAALGSLKSKPVNSVKNELNSSSKIVLLKDISLCDKLIFTLALFKEAAHELIYTSDYSSFAYRTPNKKGDSPYIFTYERKNYYYFTYNDKLNSYILTEPNDIENSIWINI